MIDLLIITITFFSRFLLLKSFIIYFKEIRNKNQKKKILFAFEIVKTENSFKSDYNN